MKIISTRFVPTWNYQISDLYRGLRLRRIRVEIIIIIKVKNNSETYILSRSILHHRFILHEPNSNVHNLRIHKNIIYSHMIVLYAFYSNRELSDWKKLNWSIFDSRMYTTKRWHQLKFTLTSLYHFILYCSLGNSNWLWSQEVCVFAIYISVCG